MVTKTVLLLIAALIIAAFGACATGPGSEEELIQDLSLERIENSTDCAELGLWFILAFEELNQTITQAASDRGKAIGCPLFQPIEFPTFQPFEFPTAAAPKATATRSAPQPTAANVTPMATPTIEGSHLLNAAEVKTLFRRYAEQASGGDFSFFSCWGVANGMDSLFTTNSQIEAERDITPGMWVITSTVESSIAAPVTRKWTFRESNRIFVGPC